jgi:hypothetical protein
MKCEECKKFSNGVRSYKDLMDSDTSLVFKTPKLLCITCCKDILEKSRKRFWESLKKDN